MLCVQRVAAVSGGQLCDPHGHIHIFGWAFPSRFLKEPLRASNYTVQCPVIHFITMLRCDCVRRCCAALGVHRMELPGDRWSTACGSVTSSPLLLLLGATQLALCRERLSPSLTTRPFLYVSLLLHHPRDDVAKDHAAEGGRDRRGFQPSLCAISGEGMLPLVPLQKRARLYYATKSQQHHDWTTESQRVIRTLHRLPSRIGEVAET